MVDNLVQQHGEVEHGEALNNGQRDPGERMGQPDEPPCGEPEDQKLPRGDDRLGRAGESGVDGGDAVFDRDAVGPERLAARAAALAGTRASSCSLSRRASSNLP